ncbi:hypothetical protein [Spiroplasma endosymbiont of 'Nebria riversi']|uniref:hypothetical protein n=1 Tax=Spiroplasma endosymbiont of 'Nebria riversi' TaxID=2792084 RepID=UPI001C03C5DC|nr:hypothetical protein [Spiroplasma endosymbiont of 'Nebria riversi']
MRGIVGNAPINKQKQQTYNIDTNEINQNMIVIDTNINIRASVGITGDKTEHVFSNLGSTEDYNFKWQDIKKNLNFILLKGSFEWNDYSSSYRSVEIFLDKKEETDQVITYWKSEPHGSKTGWDHQNGTIILEFNILKRNDGFADLNLKILVSADSYGAVHENNTYALFSTIELKN